MLFNPNDYDIYNQRYWFRSYAKRPVFDSNKKKRAIVSRHIITQVAVVDPKLTATLPPALTALTGIDAMAHCVESFLSKNGSVWSDDVALK